MCCSSQFWCSWFVHFLTLFLWFICLLKCWLDVLASADLNDLIRNVISWHHQWLTDIWSRCWICSSRCRKSYEYKNDHSVYISTQINHEFLINRQSLNHFHDISSCIAFRCLIKDLVFAAVKMRLDWLQNLHSKQHHIDREHKFWFVSDQNLTKFYDLINLFDWLSLANLFWSVLMKISYFIQEFECQHSHNLK